MQYTTLLFDVRDRVAKITLNRPGANNSINVDMARDLMHVLLRCSKDLGIRAVIITGTGRIFCTGGDLKAFNSKEVNLSYYLKETTTYFHAAVSHLVRMDAPVVAAVNGVAAGAGMSLVSRVVPDAELLVQAEALASQLAAGATKALGVSKRLLHTGWIETLETQMEHERQALANIGHTSDAHEGIAAFLEKRTPKFKGQ